MIPQPDSGPANQTAAVIADQTFLPLAKKVPPRCNDRKEQGTILYGSSDDVSSVPPYVTDEAEILEVVGRLRQTLDGIVEEHRRSMSALFPLQ